MSEMLNGYSGNQEKPSKPNHSKINGYSGNQEKPSKPK